MINHFWKWFKKKLILLLQDDEVGESETVVQSEALPSKPGLSCPKCQHRISVSMEDLVVGQKVICENCNLVLNVDMSESNETITELNKVYTAIKKAEEFKK